MWLADCEGLCVAVCVRVCEGVGEQTRFRPVSWMPGYVDSTSYVSPLSTETRAARASPRPRVGLLPSTKFWTSNHVTGASALSVSTQYCETSVLRKKTTGAMSTSTNRGVGERGTLTVADAWKGPDALTVSFDARKSDDVIRKSPGAAAESGTRRKASV